MHFLPSICMSVQAQLSPPFCFFNSFFMVSKIFWLLSDSGLSNEKKHCLVKICPTSLNEISLISDGYRIVCTLPLPSPSDTLKIHSCSGALFNLDESEWGLHFRRTMECIHNWGFTNKHLASTRFNRFFKATVGCLSTDWGTYPVFTKCCLFMQR